ncbi:phosphoenolpyruvate carboxylase [Hyphococcus flavus]|uniref:Phosphoenolpyruvate carboxylase n=1 Tax=Hyphococcus flavus TaxID=1866326 RepID=A0AAE9Z9W1_9PROT|nr:phosphoenolpyruvate carboxylase [Hyphococcus flavus]WDI30019.1 phosphoenolpyruvate carboxylase [Hyphococcus flavus]
MTTNKITSDLDAAALISIFDALDAESHEDPHLNPVARLSSELFMALERDDISISMLGGIIRELNNRAFEMRAVAFHERRCAADTDVDATLNELAERGFDAFRDAVEGARTGIVFTAHPTFALGAARRELMAAYPLGGSEQDKQNWRNEVGALSTKASDDITLRYEHGEAQKSIIHAQDATHFLNEKILKVARERFPKRWTSLTLHPASLASWVGYDLDGRTDIHWGETIRIRIAEKASQLHRYVEQIDRILRLLDVDILSGLRKLFADAADLAARQAEAFAGDLDDVSVVVRAANLLTEEASGRLVSLADAIATVTALIDDAHDERVVSSLILLRSDMQAYGLGLSRIHLRVNAAQVRSALKADLGLDPDTGFAGRSALDVAAKKATSATSKPINFASVFLEKMTARRQFMLCAQILKHIDADTPIRYLIAECEAPATVMGAVFLARHYGVEKMLDISPLFETPEAIEGGGRFIERLLQEQSFLEYITSRKRMCIQLGFSDSGRFMGQCAADLAIERLHVLFARALSDAGLTNVEALIFNTHGESMGRGAHSGAFEERLNHLATPWVRSLFDKKCIPLNTECSFQGGEGYLHFQTLALAKQTTALLWTHSLSESEDNDADCFYSDINYSWDFYRRLKSWQEDLFRRSDYRRILSGFALRFLYKTGSRQTKRARGDGFDLSALRAIPHNAILQQLCAPVNVSGGFGYASGREAERLVDHTKCSKRMKDLTALAAHARGLTDLAVLRAYAQIFSPSFWSELSVSEGTGSRADAYEQIQIALDEGATSASFNQLADFLTQDLRRFDTLLAQGILENVSSYTRRVDLSVLHSIRQALIAKAVSLVASAPPFSRRHDMDKEDLIELAFEWKLNETVELLRNIFPAKARLSEAFKGLSETLDDSAFEGGAYPEIHQRIIGPLDEISCLSRKLSQAISSHYGAFG